MQKFPPLNLPPGALKIKADKVWDPLRKKFLLLTDEEWVRQHFIEYLLNDKKYPFGRMVSEHTVQYHGQSKRCDIAVFGDDLSVQVVVECKAPHIALTEDTFFQIAKYAHSLKPHLLILTNGLDHYCAFINRKSNELSYLTEIPEYPEFLEMIS